MNMKITKTIISLAVLAVAAGCSKQAEISPDGSGTVLRVNSVSAVPVASKAVLEGTGFSDGDEVGLFFIDSKDGKTINYANVRYVCSGGAWSSSSPISLTMAKGNLYGYFPYDASKKNLEAIPVESSIDGNDYMFAVPIRNVSKNNPSVDMTMRHALALVSVVFRMDRELPGTGILTSLSLEGGGLAMNGTMNIKDTVITSSAAKVSFTGLSEEISVAGISEDCLIVPVGNIVDAQDLTLGCTIDGVDYTLDLEAAAGNGVIVRSGFHSRITLTVTCRGLELTGVDVTAWAAGNNKEKNFLPYTE